MLVRHSVTDFEQGVAALTGVSCLFFFLLSFPGNANTIDYTCMIHGAHKTKCNIWKNGKEIEIGGFQAAPIFTLTAKGEAVDHRGEKYTVTYKNGNTTFVPAKGNPYPAITIYRGDFRQK